MKIAEVTFRIVGRTPLARRFWGHSRKPAPPDEHLPGAPPVPSRIIESLRCTPFEVGGLMTESELNRVRSEVTFVIRGTSPLVLFKYPPIGGCHFPASGEKKMRRLTKAQNAEAARLRRTQGRLAKREVLEFAKNKDTALHDFFEWDNDVCGEEYRLIQAGQVIALSVDVELSEESGKEVRMYVSLSSDRVTGGGFRRTRDVLNDEALRTMMLQDALSDLRLFRERYEQLRELANVWAAADAVEKQTARKHRRKTA